MMTREQIIERISTMKETPGIWAWSEEAFVSTVLTLLEVLGFDPDTVTDWLIEINCQFKIDIEDERANIICDSALKLIETNKQGTVK